MIGVVIHLSIAKVGLEKLSFAKYKKKEVTKMINLTNNTLYSNVNNTAVTSGDIA